MWSSTSTAIWSRARDGGSRPHVRVLHLAAVGFVIADEERLERRHDLPIERALLVGLHVGEVVPQAHGEAGVLVLRILSEPAPPQALDVLALDDHVRPIRPLEVVPRAST